MATDICMFRGCPHEQTGDDNTDPKNTLTTIAYLINKCKSSHKYMRNYANTFVSAARLEHLLFVELEYSRESFPVLISEIRELAENNSVTLLYDGEVSFRVGHKNALKDTVYITAAKIAGRLPKNTSMFNHFKINKAGFEPVTKKQYSEPAPEVVESAHAMVELASSAPHENCKKFLAEHAPCSLDDVTYRHNKAQPMMSWDQLIYNEKYYRYATIEDLYNTIIAHYQSGKYGERYDFSRQDQINKLTIARCIHELIKRGRDYAKIADELYHDVRDCNFMLNAIHLHDYYSLVTKWTQLLRMKVDPAQVGKIAPQLQKYFTEFPNTYTMWIGYKP